METGSVTSSQAVVTASNAQAQLKSRQADQSQAQQTQQSPQNQQAQARRAVNEGETAARSQSEQNRATVNTSGQVVGTRVNTTA